mgnify:FL=1
MSEDLTSEVGTQAPPQEGQALDAISPQSEAVSTGTTQTPPKVNLFELPEFKDYQKATSRTMTQLQQQLQHMQAQVREREMAGLDETEQAKYRMRELEQQVQSYEAEREQQRIAWQRQQDLQKLSEKSGTPVSALNVAQTYDEAVEIAFAYQATNGRSAVKQAAASNAANRVDLGGSSSTPATRKEERMTQAMKSGNAYDFVRAALED